MALDTYDNLKATIVRFSGRDDLSDVIDDFIDLTESMMFNNPEAILLVDDLEATTTLNTVAGTNAVALPSGYLSQRSLTITASGTEIELTYNTPAAIRKHPGSGIPSHFTIEAGNIVFDITPDGVYDCEFTYLAKPTALSSANPTNAILTNYPQIYLNGSLSEMYSYVSEPEDEIKYYQKFVAAIRGANKGSRKRTHPQAQGRYRGATP